jgi:hypothetical protein
MGEYTCDEKVITSMTLLFTSEYVMLHKSSARALYSSRLLVCGNIRMVHAMAYFDVPIKCMSGDMDGW